MSIGELVVIRADAKFAYGSIGRPPIVGTDTTVEFEIELLRIKLPKAAVGFNPELPTLDKVVMEGKRESTNYLLKKDVSSYNRVMKFLEDTGDEEEYASTHSAASTTSLSCHAAQMGLTRSPSAGRFELDEASSLDSTPSGNGGMPESLDALNDILRIDPDNVKCLYRKGQILMARHDYADASQCLSRAVGLDPKNGPLQKELVRCLQLKALAPREERVLRSSRATLHSARNDDRDSCGGSRPRSPSAMSSSSSTNAFSPLSSPPAGVSNASIMAGLAVHDAPESRPARIRSEIDDHDAPLPARRATKLPFWKKKIGTLFNGVGCCGRRGLQSQAGTQSTQMRASCQDSIW